MLPLDHITVLDLSRGYPPAYAVTLLSDFGARVIRVGSPQERRFSNDREAAVSPRERNRESIVVDLKQEPGRDVLYRLVEMADVLVEGLRPGVMKRLGADYTTLKEMNPRLVYCSVTGYGQDGPYSQLAGHDMCYVATSGALSMCGSRDGRPYPPSNYVGDFGGGAMHAALGILLALAAREKTGKGQFVDISYLDGALSLMNADFSMYFGTGIPPRPGETPSTCGDVAHQIYRCKDGEYIAIASPEAHIWGNICRALGKEDLIPYGSAKGEKKDKIVAELASIFATRTRDEWFAFFLDKDVGLAKVNHVEEAAQDPQVLHRRMVVEVEHPTLGKVKTLGIPIKLSDTPGKIRSLGSPRSAHTDRILSELRYSGQEIGSMRQCGAVG